MTTYRLRKDVKGPVKISDDHFGVNVVTTYDQEFADPNSPLSELVDTMGASVLRFPGGTVTELYFDMTAPNKATSSVSGVPPLTPLDDFLDAAGKIDAGVSLVVPTRVAFAQSAASSMISGTYGERTKLDRGYLNDVEAFIRGAIKQAKASGTEIVSIELGNEFWYGGQMTAAEYGYVAGRLAVRVQDVLDDLGKGGIEILAQSTSAASRIYSPKNDTTVYISGSEVSSSPGGVPVVVPGQGTARAQLKDITDAIKKVPGAAEAVDGAVLHSYNRKGLGSVDTEKDFAFSQLQAFGDNLNRPDLGLHITEWNVASGSARDNSGLKQAAMMIEAFHEMLEHGVTNAQIWPLTFNAAQGTSMVDLNDQRLAIAGEMFKLMQESLPGLTPNLDWEIAGKVDIHGYTSQSRAALFVSERSGKDQINFTLDAREILPGRKYFVSATELWDGGAGGASAGAKPILTDIDGKSLNNPSQYKYSVHSWATLRVELTEITRGNDEITGRGGNDTIHGDRGNDVLRGGNGNDHLNGGQGADELFGGQGNDFLKGSKGRDVLTGGSGNDQFKFGSGHGHDTITDMDFNGDRLRIDKATVSSISELVTKFGASLSNSSDGLKISYGKGDSVTLEGYHLSKVLGGRTNGTKNADIMIGTSGNDDLRGGKGDDFFLDGKGRDSLHGSKGSDTFALVADGELDRIRDFEVGVDIIDLSRWNLSGFKDLQIEIAYNSNGRWLKRGFIRTDEEAIRMDGMDAEMLSAISADDFIF